MVSESAGIYCACHTASGTRNRPAMSKEFSLVVQIVVADDHPIISSGVRVLLEQDPHMRVVAEVTSPDDLIRTLDATACGLVVTDFNMPGEQAADGLSLLQLLGRRWANL